MELFQDIYEPDVNYVFPIDSKNTPCQKSTTFNILHALFKAIFI